MFQIKNQRYAEDLKEIFAGLAIGKAVFLTLGLSHFCACAWHYLGEDCRDEYAKMVSLPYCLYAKCHHFTKTGSGQT